MLIIQVDLLIKEHSKIWQAFNDISSRVIKLSEFLLTNLVNFPQLYNHTAWQKFFLALVCQIYSDQLTLDPG